MKKNKYYSVIHNSKPQTPNQLGFTFIELILYTAIVSVMMITLITFALNIIEGSTKSSTQQEVYTQARYISERIKHELRNASDINTSSSNFGVNLTTNTTAQLSLSESSGPTPVIFDVANGYIRVAIGGNTPIPLNSSDTKITNLTFTNYTSSDSKTKNIQFTLTVSSNFANAGNRQEFNDSTTIESDAEIRSN